MNKLFLKLIWFYCLMFQGGGWRVQCGHRVHFLAKQHLRKADHHRITRWTCRRKGKLLFNRSIYNIIISRIVCSKFYTALTYCSILWHLSSPLVYLGMFSCKFNYRYSVFILDWLKLQLLVLKSNNTGLNY